VIRLLADENLDGNILRGFLRRLVGVDILRLQDIGLTGADDPTVLAWAAEQGGVLITHDVATVTRYACEPVAAGLPMPGVVEIVAAVPIGQAIEELALIIECSKEGELNDQVLDLPL